MPPLGKNRVDFCRNLAFTETPENVVFPQFNFCWLSKVALLECVFGSRREFVSKNASFEEDFISFFTNCLPYISSPLGGIRGGLYFRVFGSRREFVSKNASFEEDFISFLLIVSRIFLPPLGGLEGGFIFAFLRARESLIQKTRF